MVIATAAMIGSIWGLYRYSAARSKLLHLLPGLFIVLVIPAPIPDYPEFLAPAFLVTIFEWAFQDNGQPGVALRILGIAFILGVIVGAGLWFLRRTLSRRSATS